MQFEQSKRRAARTEASRGSVKSTFAVILKRTVRFLAGIAPASLRRDAATLALARKAQKYDWHILHKATTTPAPPCRLKSRHPYNKAAQEMLQSIPEDLSRDTWLAASWKQTWETAGPSRILRYIRDPGDGQRVNSVTCVPPLGQGDEEHRQGSGTWSSVEVKGTPSSARTYHTSSACVGDWLFVFSGGDIGALPVSDPQLHVFDSVSLTWQQPETQGRPPPARHGHMVAAVGSKLYIHGGLAGEKFHSDMYSLDTNKQRWTLLKFEGDLPSDRLDHSMCVVPWRVRKDECSVGDQAPEPETVNLCFIFGGMDTHGVIHSDCVATLLP
ncbi:hypothetical protein AAFF_G00062520 [Aldrovandia affinis]|uniref:Rab9 effector protein with kelch motifs n=1 Tax=Aldrovandia affinis TaxID=143900 RepID=A0AAD7R1R6_9TELE|nr:hypothetical protein AAFF_G00062520 [Aldrovandia affinis]